MPLTLEKAFRKMDDRQRQRKRRSVVIDFVQDFQQRQQHTLRLAQHVARFLFFDGRFCANFFFCDKLGNVAEFRRKMPVEV